MAKVGNSWQSKTVYIICQEAKRERERADTTSSFPKVMPSLT
jgi:hypothetical protein